MVERELELRLLLSPDFSVPVAALLAYRTTDPYAVHVTFHIGSAQPVHWTFARELLVDGVFRPAGEGDVRVRPERVDGRAAVLLELRSPEGDAVLAAPAPQLSAWLERTLVTVAPGTESELLGLDEELARITACTDGTGPRPRPRPRDDEGGITSV